MANRNYLKGIRLERAAKKMLEADGYTVARSAGSHSDFDLYCINQESGEVLLVQVKSTKGGMAAVGRLRKQWQANLPFKRSVHYVQAMLIWADRTWWVA